MSVPECKELGDHFDGQTSGHEERGCGSDLSGREERVCVHIGWLVGPALSSQVPWMR